MPTPTFSDAATIITQSRAETGIGASPVSTALQTDAMLRVLNDINSQFVNYPYTMGMLGWKFLLSETIISTVANTTLNGAISSGATTLTLTSATNFYDPADADIGAFYVKTANNIYDFACYEDKDSNDLQVVSGLQIAHASGEEVHKIYGLPSDFGKVRNVFLRSNLYAYRYVDPDFTQLPRGTNFTIRTFTSTSNFSGSFLIFREDIGALEFKVQYLKAPTTIDETTDKTNAPDGSARRYLIECLNSYIWNVLGEGLDADRAKARAEEALRQSLMEWAVAEVTPIQNVRLHW